MFDRKLFQNNKKLILCTSLCMIFLACISILIRSELKRINYTSTVVPVNNQENIIHKLVINELMSSNKGALVDENGNSSDWIELYNGHSYPINLRGYGLSDSNNGMIKWSFPSVEIGAGEFLIVYLSGEGKGKLHASFALKQEGDEIITLWKPNGKIVDSVRTVPLEKNTTMARDYKGNWIVTDEITPGYENSTRGREKFLNSFQENKKDSPLVLTEFLPVNEGNVIFPNQKLLSYVEVKNVSKKNVSLKDYFLSNNEDSVYKWRLPDVSLKAGESYLIFTDSQNEENHASFELKRKTGNVILSSYQGVIENVSYENLTKGVAYLKEEGEWKQSVNVSPGYENTPNGIEKFQGAMDQAPKTLLISEVMSSNQQYLVQNGNQYYDWIELHNNSPEAINLNLYSLSTDIDQKNMYRLPERILLSGSYCVIMASGIEQYSNASYDHANFKISSSTGLYLFKNDTLIDALYVHNIPKGYSYGRGEAGGHFYYAQPTPVGPNSEVSFRRAIYEPTFQVKGGVYNSVTNIKVSFQKDSNVDIYYTLDGSMPSLSSNRYQEPINLTHTTVVKAASFLNGQQVSGVATNSYVINEKHSLPVLSLSLPNDQFQWVYSNTDENASSEAHLEFYEKKTSFSKDVTVKLHGGDSRDWAKKSFSVKFEPHLYYKVFDDKDLVEFSALVLRGGSQDQNRAMMRDEFATSLARHYGTLDAQAVKPAVLYINGQYWGIYYIREKVNSSFIEDNHNVSGPTNIVNYYYGADEGSSNDVLHIKYFIQNHEMKEDKNYQYVAERLDMDNFIDFWVFQFLTVNQDIHNYRFYNNPHLANGKVRMILFDLDYGMYNPYGDTYLDYIQKPDGSQSFLDTTIISGLMQNDTFRKRFAKRVGYALKNVWTEDHIEKEYQRLYQAIDKEMPRNCQRWNMSYTDWQKNANSMKNATINRIRQARRETVQYFQLTKEEENEYFG